MLRRDNGAIHHFAAAALSVVASKHGRHGGEPLTGSSHRAAGDSGIAGATKPLSMNAALRRSCS